MHIPERHTGIRAIGIVALLAAGLTVSACASAQQARDRIIESAHINAGIKPATLTINLTFPFHYRSHYPQETGKELRIRVQPVQVPSSDLGAVFLREGMTPPDAEVAAIDEVIYEGDAIGGPVVTVRFTHPVRYQVIPGSDHRSLSVSILEISPGDE